MHYALISFLNARPLWWGLVHGKPREGETREFTSPARCADLIADGTASLGLVPAIEIVRIPGVVAVPDLCIASRSEVRSVLLVSRVEIDAIRSVALDPNSRTSIALARILLGERLGQDRYDEIRFDPVEAQRLLTLEGHDAAVVIGDRALQVSAEPESRADLNVYDLVSEWSRMYGDPFVFALWAGRRDRLADAKGVRERLIESYRFGIEHLDRIASEASAELGVPRAEINEYFESALHYEFEAPERRGLERFNRLAAKYGLIPEPKEVEWLEATSEASKKS
ncbi:MAG: menaquinone biosynthesis protein [Thermoanaerobaculia bacterium]|nr:menaquinone biosynthesis protein [Thermoanaerobaculia bacterium]